MIASRVFLAVAGLAALGGCRADRGSDSALLESREKEVKQRIESGRIPTIADVRARRIETLQGTLRETLIENAFDAYRVAVQSLAEQFDPLDIAAAAAKLAAEATLGDETQDLPVSRAPQDYTEPRRERKPYEGKRKTHDDGGARPPKRRNDATTRLVITLGEQRGVRPKDIVGAIANEAGIPGHSIGSIEIGEKQSVVEVPESAVDKVIAALTRTTIKGQRVSARRERE